MANIIEPQPERIRRIKEEKDRQGLTNQKIVDRALSMKEYTSLSSVYRVCLDGSENVGFRDATLRPIEKALGIENSDKPEVAPGADYLKQIIHELNEQLKASRRAHAMKNAAIAFLAVLLVGLLAVDRALPEVGWYGTSGAAVWWSIFALLVAFVCAVFAYHLHFRVRVTFQQTNPEDADGERDGKAP